jgi:cellulose synthase/poly-beta-1,6-N-acetylglucosamine synthase-like glycosyltransferase
MSFTRSVVDSPNLKNLHYPFISIILPMKNEANVAKRALESLLKQEYPPNQFELIIVEDGSTDKTPEICLEYVTRYPDQIQYIHREVSTGKPSALNAGFTHAHGDIIGVFDADNVPEPSLLTRVATRFNDAEIVALQGQLGTINPIETMLSRLVHHERMMQLHLHALAKERLKLFVPFAGTNLFIRRTTLEQMDAWQEDALSEDLELAAKLIQAQHIVTYAPEIRAWQEAPSTFRQLMTQRTRWYRGCMDVAIQYGELLKTPSILNVDAELYFFGPFTLMLALITGLMYSALIALQLQPHMYTTIIAQVSCIGGGIMITVWGLLLTNITRPRTIANLKLLPLVYLYCAFQSVIATFAFCQIVFRRPRKWIRTKKTGARTITGFENIHRTSHVHNKIENERGRLC